MLRIRRTPAIALLAVTALAAGAAGGTAATSTPQPQLSTVTFVGTLDGALSGFAGDSHRVSILMKRGNTDAFGKNQVNYVNVESFTCAAGSEVPLAGPAPSGCTSVGTTSMRNNDTPTAWVSSTGRSASMTGTFTSRTGPSRSLPSTLKFFHASPAGEHSFGHDMSVRNDAGRYTGTIAGKKATKSAIMVTTFGE